MTLYSLSWKKKHFYRMCTERRFNSLERQRQQEEADSKYALERYILEYFLINSAELVSARKDGLIP